MNVQNLPQLLNQAYEIFDSSNLSVTALVAIAIVLTCLGLFAVREAASWFFKIDEIKSDVKNMKQLVVDMEAEVRLLQGLLSQNAKLAEDRAAIELAANKSEKPRFAVTH